MGEVHGASLKREIEVGGDEKFRVKFLGVCTFSHLKEESLISVHQRSNIIRLTF